MKPDKELWEIFWIVVFSIGGVGVGFAIFTAAIGLTVVLLSWLGRYLTS